MIREDIEKLEKIEGSFAFAAAKVLADGQLTRRIVEDWLGTMFPMWRMFYGSLGKDVLEGHLTGPSPSQANILIRMRDKGHRLAPVRGFIRWIGGNDVRVHRNSVRLMIERGWLRIVESQVMGLEYLIIPTREGMVVLANYEFDKEDRGYP